MLLLLLLLALLHHAAQGFLVPTPAATPSSSLRRRPDGGLLVRRSSLPEGVSQQPLQPQKPPASASSYRQVALVKRFARLPFWPIWHGLLIMLLDQVMY